MNIWLVIRVIGDDEHVEYMGAWDDRGKAEMACRAQNDCVYGPFVVNEQLPEEPLGSPPDCYFPLAPEYWHERLRKDGKPIEKGDADAR